MYCRQSHILASSSNICKLLMLILVYIFDSGFSHFLALEWHFFDDISLHELGHRGLPCPQPLAELKAFTVVDLSGLHMVHLSFCGCQNVPEWCVQLLQQAWFPSSTKSPETTFTFDFLNTFHILNLQSKTSLYNFWLTIHHKGDNAGIKSNKVSFICIHTCFALCLWFSLALLWSTPSHCMNLVPYQTHQACRMWSLSCRCCHNSARWLCSWVHSLPSSWKESPRGLGEKSCIYHVCMLATPLPISLLTPFPKVDLCLYIDDQCQLLPQTQREGLFRWSTIREWMVKFCKAGTIWELCEWIWMASWGGLHMSIKHIASLTHVIHSQTYVIRISLLLIMVLPRRQGLLQVVWVVVFVDNICRWPRTGNLNKGEWCIRLYEVLYQSTPS